MKTLSEREIFFEALAMPTPESRAPFASSLWPDLALYRKVDELLKEHFSNDRLLAGCAWNEKGPPKRGVVRADTTNERRFLWVISWIVGRKFPKLFASLWNRSKRAPRCACGQS
jgi:hypothetical protein